MNSEARTSQQATRTAARTAGRNNRLDVHRIGVTHLGIFREPFDRVAYLSGFQLKPADADLTVWTFKDAATGMQGRLLDVAGYLQQDHMVLSSGGMTYMVRDHGRMLGLLLPADPRKIKLTQVNFTVLPQKNEAAAYPPHWPRGLVLRVIRNWLHNVVIIDEKYLLARLTLD